jgi:hypothetical protein
MSWEIIPVLKKELVLLTIGRSALKRSVFVEEITDEFVQRLDVLQACDVGGYGTPRVTTGVTRDDVMESRGTTTIILPDSG